MYGRKLQRKPAQRRPITFTGFDSKTFRGALQTRSGGETQQELASRLKAEHGKTTRLTPRYSR